MEANNDEERKLRLRMGEIIAQKNMSDETLHKAIWNCAAKGWVEELRLCVNVPRSSVECLLYIDCVLFGLCKNIVGNIFGLFFCFVPKQTK